MSVAAGHAASKNVRCALVARTLLVHVEGLVDLGLFPAIVEQVAWPGRRVREILVDLTEVTGFTDSGCAAFIAIDRFAIEHRIDTTLVNAGSEIIKRVSAHCSSMRWVA